MDIHSHVEPNRVRVSHVSLNLNIDFENKQLAGSATLTLDRRDPSAPLILDIQDLVIDKIISEMGFDLQYSIGAADPNLGSALNVGLMPHDTKITVFYHTTEKAGALQWLGPEQTAGGRRPFLFTQGQSIFTRSWIPLQDSPAVRITYDAVISAPPGLTPVMSARQQGAGPDGKYHFDMNLPIPPYLIALACGELKFLPISDRCGIWAEPPVADGARWEFEDSEKMVQAVERLFGKYRWGRYDILVLPPSFPFGGMENPTLTFATPTVLAGDKSLVSLVAHELAHSWSGNLVTNATWSDFWLNEGFTMYLEGRIMEEVYGAEHAKMEMQLGRADLEREMKELEPRDQILHVDLSGRHPDDGFTGIPYEKAVMFLRRLEALAGRGAFDKFLNHYFDSRAFQSITTDEFLKDLREQLLKENASIEKNININEWIYKPGLPADAPRVVSKALVEVDKALELYKDGKSLRDVNVKGWVTQQWQHFLTSLPGTIDAKGMDNLDGIFHFTESKNSEILGEWLRLAIKNSYQPAYGKLEEFLMNVGRRKFLKPLYSEFAKTEEGKRRGREIYKKARARYHPVAVSVIDKILE
ncbi:MAG: M1 family metallopeptidase [Planctomycetes bacterium]|nr:M1 family metallopeptidase [Planctomycetota bacterium]